MELKGGMCKLLWPDQWLYIYSLMRRYEGRINRFDLAADDWFGKHFIQPKIKALYEKNPRCLLPRGFAGKSIPIGIHDTYKGYTLTFGTKASSVYHVIYQKARESEGSYLAKQYPAWMRWEVRFCGNQKLRLVWILSIPIIGS